MFLMLYLRFSSICRHQYLVHTNG